MGEIVKANLPFKRKEITKAEAKKLFANQPYKLELIEDIADDKVGIYEQGNFTDLCRGPHVKSTGEIKAFKLTSIAGAYWRGDEHNAMLQRIYGIAFNSQKELDDYLTQHGRNKKERPPENRQGFGPFRIFGSGRQRAAHLHGKGVDNPTGTGTFRGG